MKGGLSGLLRPGSTRIRQELKSTSQDGLKAGLSAFCIPQADPYPRVRASCGLGTLTGER